ncbi:glycosyltransferase [Xaviernesmea oryzae]|uniref:Glycosyltransferase n=1 Tax=Xaviernesmea oryzae TaxID=464029 RepID=A0A1Q9B264_9HYPH|nr:glycosyltransferase [Xaviernesmea oryzae]OLP62086.1 glycosyltransferase [Xaviernesmea oryzae]SEL86927.1 Spore maturation protein CgeB [Xaviernesmea oryzae]
MRFLFYTHSLVSDWNHGNAHFLRGLCRDLIRRGHGVVALEPEDAWSLQNLLADQGQGALDNFSRAFPMLGSTAHGADFDHEAALDAADVVIVHEWTDPALVARIGRARQAGGRFTLIFHDTHHRAVSAEGEIAGLDLSGYDLVLAFGETLRQRYLDAGWGRSVFTWHEAADDALFHPMPEIARTGDVIWIGNWGDDERSAEIGSFLIEPVSALGLSATVRGVRYPQAALDALQAAGIQYGGWIANALAPEAFAAHRLTVHIPRRPYVENLPGIPTIRMFEALACGIPLISAPWDDSEGLFAFGRDFLFARDGGEMTRLMRVLLSDPDMARELAEHGRRTVLSRHTCRHRVDELLAILAAHGTRQVRDGLAAPAPSLSKDAAA